MKIKESSRTHLLLSICDDMTEWEGDERPGRTLTLWWYVRSDAFSKILGKHVPIRGSGDASILRSLERHGLIRAVARAIGAKHSYAITEEGISALSQLSADALRDAFLQCQYRDDDDSDTVCGAPPSALLHDVTKKYPISADNHPFVR